jgi:ABC-2 type transport system permease protein
MNHSIGRMKTIIQKDWLELRRNTYMSSMALLPIIIALFYSSLDAPASSSAVITIMIALSMPGSFVQAMLIAEEKEKETLRALIQSPASAGEVLIGKSVLTGIVTALVTVICLSISGISPIQIGKLAVLWVPLLLMFLALGTILGLLCKSVQATSTAGLPILLAFIMFPMIAPIFDSVVIKTINAMLPVLYLNEGLQSILTGESVFSLTIPFFVILAWLFTSMIFVVFVYRKNRFEE